MKRLSLFFMGSLDSEYGLLAGRVSTLLTQCINGEGILLERMAPTRLCNRHKFRVRTIVGKLHPAVPA